MIVRVLEEEQYRLDDAHLPTFEERDRALQIAVEDDDHAAFQAALTDLLAFVRANGVIVPIEEIIPSDVVVPAEDMSLAEAKQLLENDAKA
jgi:hypothetical protein